MQFHARQGMGGTMIVYDGKVTKVNLKTDSTLSAGVYPAWHPTERLIVYSTNATGQTFHTANPNKIEVQDKASDLILYDMDKNEVSTISAEPNELETYPCWSPDGKYIYYASAHFEKHDTATTDLENMKRYREFKYNLYRRPFDLKSKTFGAKELVLDAAAIDKSATLPRISPDGKRLMFAMAEYGCFHIWHKDADLYVMELTDTVGHPAEALSNYRNVQEINSPEVESYHTWSSNNRWVVFSSRRNDGNYTRPFIAHIDKNGKWGKPFELPQEDPDYHRQLLSSYNLPEFMSGPVTVKKRDLVKTFEQEARQALYRQK
jgi:Tol biopolymer transport system component